ncbi:MAG TPA: type II toxin-antitoxin system VapC family toxin [Vicinamibacterales bacterium]|nr:type II toxin-antitoxin system VapC family toxin [Vicinamibacterales bacterium]
MQYFDASALAKRYVREKGSVKVRRLLSSGLAATSRYSAVEIASALARRTREGAISPDDRERTMAALQTDLSAMLIVELTAEVVIRAQALLQRHSLRAGDAVQLASCLRLREELEDDVSLVAFDERLVAAARKERVALV